MWSPQQKNRKVDRVKKMIVDSDNYRLKHICLTNAYKNEQQPKKIFFPESSILIWLIKADLWSRKKKKES